MSDVQVQVEALGKLINNEFSVAWGAQGVPGSELQIIRVCKLVSDAGTRLLDWEEKVKFSKLPQEFEEPRQMLVGIAGPQIEALFEIPRRFSQAFATNQVGVLEISLKFSVPFEWGERFANAMRKSVAAFRTARGLT